MRTCRSLPSCVDAPWTHVRIETKNAAALKTTLEAAGYDVLRVDRRRSTVDPAVTRAEWLALESRGYSVTVVDLARPPYDALHSSTINTLHPHGFHHTVTTVW